MFGHGPGNFWPDFLHSTVQGVCDAAISLQTCACVLQMIVQLGWSVTMLVFVLLEKLLVMHVQQVVSPCS